MKRFVVLALAGASLAQGCASVDHEKTKISVSPKGAQVEVLLGGKRTVATTQVVAVAPVVTDSVKIARIELLKEVVKVLGQVGIEFIKAQAKH